MSILAPIQPTESSAEKTTSLNAADDAMACAALFGWNEILSEALTWCFFGGTWPVQGAMTQIASSFVTLAASATNYIEADLMAASAAVVVLVNQTGFTPGRVPLYTVQCDGIGPILGDITDVRPWVLPQEGPYCSVQTVSVTGGTVNLTQAQAAAKVVKFTGTLTSAAIAIFPLAQGFWAIDNETGGAFTLIVQGATGAGVAVTQGNCALVYCNGSGFFAIIGNTSATGSPGHGATTTTSTFAIAAAGSTQVVPVVDPVAFPVEQVLIISDGTNSIFGSVTAVSGSNLTVETSAINTGTAGATMASGATVSFSGPSGASGVTLNTKNVFTKNQIVQAVWNNTASGTIAPDVSVSQTLGYLMTGNLIIGTPTDGGGTPVDGTTLNLWFKQGSAGGYTLTLPSNFKPMGAAAPGMPSAVGARLFLSASYYAADAIWAYGGGTV